MHEFGVWKPSAIAAEPGLLATVAFQDGRLARSREAIENALAKVSSPARRQASPPS